MKTILDSIGKLLVPAFFVGAAIWLFSLGHPIAGGVCILLTFLTARN